MKIKCINHHCFQIIIFIFFIGITTISLLTFKDFGISTDEKTQLEHLKINANKIYNTFHILQLAPKSIQSAGNYLFYPHKFYGVAIQYPLVFLEYFPTIFNPSQQLYWEIRHLYVRGLFILAGIALYSILKRITHVKSIILISLILFFSHPRIAAHSFYNIKDSVFLSLFTLSSYVFVKYLQNASVSMLIQLAVITAITVNSRMMGLLIPVYFFFWVLIHFHKDIQTIRKVLSVYIFTFGVTLYMVWPYLWESPIHQFLLSFKRFSNYSVWKESVIFNGKLIKGSALPFYYIPVWICITTPFAHLISWILGVFSILYVYTKKHIRQPINIIILYSLYVIFASYASVIFFKSTLYDDWRHLYYIFPFLIILGAFGLDFLHKKNRVIYTLIYAYMVFSISSTLYWMIRNHPHYYVYFNVFAGKEWGEKWDRDTWRLSAKQALLCLENDSQALTGSTIKIYDNPHLNLNKNILPSSLANKIEFISSSASADYLIGDYRYQIGEYDTTYYYGFEKSCSITVDNNEIMTLYKKTRGKK